MDTAEISGEGRRERDRSIDCDAVSGRAPIQMIEWLGDTVAGVRIYRESDMKAEALLRESCLRHSGVAWP